MKREEEDRMFRINTTISQLEKILNEHKNQEPEIYQKIIKLKNSHQQDQFQKHDRLDIYNQKVD